MFYLSVKNELMRYSFFESCDCDGCEQNKKKIFDFSLHIL
jgi:hypothetical protein